MRSGDRRLRLRTGPGADRVIPKRSGRARHDARIDETRRGKPKWKHVLVTRSVDVKDDGVAEIGVGNLRGRQAIAARELGPDVRAHASTGLVDPLDHCRGHLRQRAPLRRRGRDRPENLALVAQHVDVGDGFPAAGDQDRDVDQDSSSVVGRGEPAPCIAADRAPVSPTWSASSRVATFPA